ncbi:MAG: hypothetical protein AAGD86_06290, partial [Pseudomonadota bacterium]
MKSKTYAGTLFLIGTLLSMTLRAALPATAIDAATPPTVSTAPATLHFEPNQGQFDPSIDFVARGAGYTVMLDPLPVVELYRYRNANTPAGGRTDHAAPRPQQLDGLARLRLTLVGASDAAAATPLEQTPALTHYLIGEEANWRTDMPNYERIRYSEVLPSIDVEYYGTEGQLEYDFVVHPGGNPDVIQLAFDGADAVRIDDDGDLVIAIDGKEIVQRAPFSYQVTDDGQRTVVPSAYVIDGDAVGFRLGTWDNTRALVIDPVIEYSRYFGGARFESPAAVELDAAGNIYVIATSTSSGLATPGSLVDTFAGARGEFSSVRFCSDCTDAVEGRATLARADVDDDD